MPVSKYVILCLLALANCLNAVLIFMQPAWFNPFVGVLCSVVTPFAAAMTVLFRAHMHNGTKPLAQ